MGCAGDTKDNETFVPTDASLVSPSTLRHMTSRILSKICEATREGMMGTRLISGVNLAGGSHGRLGAYSRLNVRRACYVIKSKSNVRQPNIAEEYICRAEAVPFGGLG